MAEMAEAMTSPMADKTIMFRGTPRNLVPGIAMLLATLMAFTMGMTNVFFAKAIAWTLVVWGLLLIYGGLMDVYATFSVTDDALIIKDLLRPWAVTEIWGWDRITRLEIAITRPDIRARGTMLRVYYAPESELAVERQDRAYDDELARLIIEKAGLQPADNTNPQDLKQLPVGKKVTFVWTK